MGSVALAAALALLACERRPAPATGTGAATGTAAATATGTGAAAATATGAAAATATGAATAMGTAAPVRAALPGDRLAYRFTAHAGEATLSRDPEPLVRPSTPGPLRGPSAQDERDRDERDRDEPSATTARRDRDERDRELDAAFAALEYPAKIVSPYAGLSPQAATRVIELALADADVAAYGRHHPPDAARPAARKLPTFDPVWNRTRAVYESKVALFAPTPSRYAFSVPPVAHGLVRLALATPPGSGDAELSIEVDGQARLTRAVPAAAAGTWIPIELPVENARSIAFTTRAPKPTAVALGDPLLLARDEGAPGDNVLLVIIDTLRADALPVMPRLSALAARGVSFEQAITAAAWTRPSILSMLGGDLPTAIGQSAEQMIPSDAERRRFYAVAPPLLPRVLERAGWQADAIGNNFFLLGYPQIGLTLGFDEVADIRHPVLDTPAIAAAASSFLAAHGREAFYLHLHFDAPHWPYTPPPEYLARVTVPPGFPDDAEARAYLAEAAYADDYLGRVLDELERQKLSERTLVIVVGDHGEIFDHAHAHTVVAMGQPTLHHHGWSAYDELLRVPLVMALPGKLPARRVREQVSLIDLEPTVLDVLGLPMRPGARGRSLRPLWSPSSDGGREAREERPAFTEGQNVRSLRMGGWHYLRRGDGRLRPDGGGPERKVEEELYELSTDPLEHKDRTSDAPAALARMRAAFAAAQPAMRDAPVSVLHLRLAPDQRPGASGQPTPHVVEGTLRTEGTLAIRAVAGAEASPLDAHAVRLTLRGPALVDLVVDPPSARIELELRKDGSPLDAHELLLGPFGLPLLQPGAKALLAGATLSWLDAARAPVLGERGELLLWRDPSAITPLAPQAARTSSEVAGMMRRWGYAQPGK